MSLTDDVRAALVVMGLDSTMQVKSGEAPDEMVSVEGVTLRRARLDGGAGWRGGQRGYEVLVEVPVPGSFWDPPDLEEETITCTARFEDAIMSAVYAVLLARLDRLYEEREGRAAEAEARDDVTAEPVG